MQALSHKFIEALEEPRDQLYALALARTGSPAAAETALLNAARQLFIEFAKDAIPDIPAAMRQSLGAAQVATVPSGSGSPNGETPIAQTPMPADVWARLSAAVQIEAAQSSHSAALNPDSVLLRPDPLLAPKKSKPRDDTDDFELSSPSRLVFIVGAAVLVGIVVTIFIVSRPSTPRATTHAASAPSRAPAPAPRAASTSPSAVAP